MAILTTDVGRNATTNAEKGGFLLNLASFAVTEKEDVTLSVEDKQLEGQPVYQHLIQSIEVVSEASIRCTLYIPPKVPAQGKLMLREIGLYLQSGELFAHGTFRTPFEKSSEFGLKIYVIVTCARLGEVVNVSFSSSFGLDSTVVHSLIDPAHSGSNAVIIQDAVTINDEDASAALAMRFASDGSKWAFTDHNRVYHGRSTVASPSGFTLDTESTGGFWLNDNEIVIASTSAGPGAGETRRAQYKKSSKSFVVLQQPFSALTATSTINIWRLTKNQLPERGSEVPAYYMLGIGQNDWKSVEIGSVSESYDLVQGQVSLLGTGTAILNLPQTIPASALTGGKSSLMVFVSGSRIGIGEFALSGRSLVFNTPVPPGAEVGVIYFEKKPSTGSTVFLYSADYSGYAAVTTEFQLGTLPENKAGLMVFVSGLWIDPKHYDLVGSKIAFTDMEPEGEISIVSTVRYVEDGSSSLLIQTASVLSVGMQAIPVAVDTFDRNNVVLNVDGKYLSRDKFSTTSRQIILNDSYDRDVAVQVFIAVSKGKVSAPEYTTTGKNTGPVWQDPAGSVGEPNTLLPVVLNCVSTGEVDYVIPPNTPRKSHVLVFVGGQFQDPISYSFEGTKITLSAPPPSGIEVDIVAFTTTPSKGSRASCHSFTFTTSANKTYNISGFTSKAPTLIFVGGVYQHLSQYSINGSALTFQDALPSGVLVEAWVFDTIEDLGSSCLIAQGNSTIEIGKTSYNVDISLVKDASGNIQNTLLFASTVFQRKASYSTSVTAQGVQTFTAHDELVQAENKTLTAFVFLSGKSKTRLITRDEFEARNAGAVGLPNSSGWAILPSGMMIQCGFGGTVTGKNDFVYFPVQFPNRCLTVTVSECHAAGWGDDPWLVTMHGASDFTQAGYYHYCVVLHDGDTFYSPGIGFNYIAIGF